MMVMGGLVWSFYIYSSLNPRAAKCFIEFHCTFYLYVVKLMLLGM